MVSVRCKVCGTELVSHPVRTKSCGCSNMTTVKGDTITALDLSKVVMTSSDKQSKTSNLLTKEDLAFQEARRNRTVRKLDFEIR
jgi:ssDNA-binding Zn-finger/Zn-ribbon topoisomerase 1